MSIPFVLVHVCLYALESFVCICVYVSVFLCVFLRAFVSVRCVYVCECVCVSVFMTENSC